MLKSEIAKKYNELYQEIYENYNKVLIIDDCDFCESNPFTIIYLNKEESFDKFKDRWEENMYVVEEYDDYYYDDILWRFEKYNKEDFDFIEIGTLNVFTDKEYNLYVRS